MSLVVDSGPDKPQMSIKQIAVWLWDTLVKCPIAD